jgi:outer membrane protein
MKQLFILAFAAITLAACNKEGNTGSSTQSAGRIVYVNTDTLLNNYEFYKDVVKEFEKKRFELENDISKKGQSFQNKVALFQKRIQAGGMSQSQAETTQQQLQKEEQDIMMYRDNAAASLGQEQASKTDEMLSNIQDYLGKYNAGDKYDMVIGYSKGGGVLYAKENLDITAEVLKGLNEEYAAKNGKTSTPSDSTSN